MPDLSRSHERRRSCVHGPCDELALVTSDPRAEDLKRIVCFERASVTISRRLAGIRMRIRVPTSLYRGVLLETKPGEASTPSYKLRLDHADADLSVPLMEICDSAEIVAEWTAWANFFGLPRLLRTPSGRLASFDHKMGMVSLGEARYGRKRGRIVAARRARFLTRRKPGVGV